MGRHRRATPAAPEPVVTAPYAGGRRRSTRGTRGAHRKASPAPVRTGLLGASAAMAMGAVAVASGLIPGPGGGYTVGGSHGPADQVQADGPGTLATQGVTGSPTPSERDTRAADRNTRRSASPDDSATPSRQAGKDRDDASSPAPSRTGSPPETGTGGGDPDGGAENGGTKPAEPGDGSGSPDAETAAEAQVLVLVNKERAQAGCRPVTGDPGLAGFADDFSEDMAERDFFSHTTPDGKSPWDRAEAAGISDLGGENIARGQADAASVMDSWMDSPGHRENILNCDYRTMGVGAHFAEGGPWWTQNFGF